MAKNLPQQIEPIPLCNTGVSLEGEIPVKRLSRLAELVGDNSGQIAISLQFGKDKHGFRTICGKIQGQLVLICQRCMQPMPYNVAVDIRLSPVFNEGQAANLPKDFDPLYVTEEPVSLKELIEDELLLNLPIVAKHQNGECSVELSNM